MKKSFSATLCVLVCSSLVMTACTKNDSKEAPVDSSDASGTVTLKMVAPKASLSPGYGEMEIFKRLEQQTNVHVDWTNIPDTDYKDKKNLLIASGDLPDAFYGADFSDYELVTYGKDGTIIPLEKLIEENAPNFSKLLKDRPDIKAAITAPDGHIYGLPIWEENELGTNPFFHVINKKWLDKLGLKVPETLDEYTNALLVFKNNDPNGNGKKDEIPLTYMNGWWCADIAGLFGAFGMPDNQDHRIVRGGKVIFTAVQPEFKEALKYFSEKWYKQGLIDPEAFTQKDAQYLAKGKTPNETVGSFIWWDNDGEYTGPNRVNDYVFLPPLTGPTGERTVGRANGGGPSRGAFVITKANKNPDATMKWVDAQYEPYMAAQIHWGPIGVVFEKDANGKLINLPLPSGVAMGEFRQKVAPNAVGVVTKNDFETIVDMEPRAKARKNALLKYYEPYMEKENYPNIFFQPDELDKINQIEPDLKKFVDSQRANFIIEGVTDAAWDNYVKQVKAMGLDELMAVYQKGLDRYKIAQK
ncbi:ABC transporter substrate-binding protein [Paenibacillus oleatilyticus]|uniref:ABC transporter substrate-binding protein n=1 Tax=Paenibacillus oleatilyticus TaxID=2594886 RepID=UPI001C1FBDB7|nr:ABC transporter substrate-binding protein [Paenibacillus oleatilyticus]MBU7316625.1 ABC transporter substrate-binding protein [Paenibacillus oleatilyticus]